MEIKMVRISEIVPYKNNPRKNAAAVEPVKQSIKEFGFKVPMILDRNNVIVTGHTRFKAAQELGMKEVPVIYADDLTEAQIRAFRLADNKTNEFAEWDENLLGLELDDLSDIDMSLFGFELSENSEGGANPYTGKVQIPQYDVQGDDVEAGELCDDLKQRELEEEILSTPGLSDDDRDFLIKASMRHLVFDYKNIAEYYAKSSAVVQRLMEKSALVIIDYEDAIANGYVTLSKALQKLRKPYAV